MRICDCGSAAINDDPERELCDRCWRDRKIADLTDLIRHMNRWSEHPGRGYWRMDRQQQELFNSITGEGGQ